MERIKMDLSKYQQPRVKSKISNQRQEVNKMFLERLNAAREGTIDKKTGKPYKPLTAGFVASRMAPMDVGQLRQFFGYCNEAKNFSSTWWFMTNPKNYDKNGVIVDKFALDKKWA